MSAAELSSVAYKKGNLMRYSLWGLAAVCIGFLIWTFISTVNSDISSSVPEGYKFAVTNNQNDTGTLRTIYYVYDDKILTETESRNDDSVNRSVLIYDGIDTSKLKYDPEDTTKVCELGVCSEKPKVILTIKKLISHKIGREYIGL